MSKPISRRSQNIRKYLKTGVSQSELVRRGYPRNTVKYHFDAMYFPERLEKRITRQNMYYKRLQDKSISE